MRIKPTNPAPMRVRSVYPPRESRPNASTPGIAKREQRTEYTPNGAMDDETGLTILQLQVMALLMKGIPIHTAARHCEVKSQTVSRWFDEHEPWQKEWKRRTAALRQTATNSILAAGSKGLSKLIKLVDHKKVNVQLSAAKALAAGLTTVVRSFEDAQQVRIAPLFMLPQSTSISFDLDVPALPPGPASVVVDAQLIKARTLEQIEQGAEDKAKTG